MSRLRCANCGAPVNVNQDKCNFCGYSLRGEIPQTSGISLRSGDPPAKMPANVMDASDRPIIRREVELFETGEASRCDLHGIVLHISDPVYEPADFNAYKFFSMLLIALGLLPLILAFIIFRIALMLFLRILGFRPHISVFGNFFWIFVGRGGRGRPAEVPVQNATIRTPEGEQRSVRIKGHLVRGTLRSGDRVMMNGHWDGGTLLLTSGVNLTTGSSLRLRRNYWMPVFFTVLAIFVAITLYILNHPLPQYP